MQGTNIPRYSNLVVPMLKLKIPDDSNFGQMLPASYYASDHLAIGAVFFWSAKWE